MNVYSQLEDVLGVGKVKTDFNLSPYLTLKTPTYAQYFLVAEDEKDLIQAYKSSITLGIPFFVIGGGSNLAITKRIIPGLVVRNIESVLKVVLKKAHYSIIEVSSGYPVTRLVNETIRLGLSGFEYHLGLPGTVGGAIYMNSKWTKPLIYFGDKLVSARLLSQKGAVKEVDRRYFHFAYDSSILQTTKEIVLTARFKLDHKDPHLLQKRATVALAYRKKTQPFGVASSGCFFRNLSVKTQKQKKLPTTSAGYLIDRAGLKGLKVGDYIVSDKHANFILNKGQGNADDLCQILRIIKSKVQKRFGIKLQEEVIVI